MRNRGETSSKRTGLYYEVQAAALLQEQGYEILEKNFRCPAGEIDLIAKDGEYLCFVEVKYRSEERAGRPEEAVDGKKQKRISRAALYYLMKQGFGDTTPCRFDVVGILDGDIRIIKNAFSFKR